jgi:hypothetical protein
MTGPIVLIVIGVLFLLNNLFPDVYRFSRLWPVILIAVGASKVLEGWLRRMNRQQSDSSGPSRKEPQ